MANRRTSNWRHALQKTKCHSWRTPQHFSPVAERETTVRRYQLIAAKGTTGFELGNSRFENKLLQIVVPPFRPPQQATTPKPTPPPIHEHQGSKSPARPPQDAPTESKFKASLSALKANMKSAGQLVANQEKRTKIAQVTLPSAYRELGRRVYGSGPYRDEFPEQYGLLDDFATKLEPTEEGKGLAASAKFAVNIGFDSRASTWHRL